MRYTLAAAAFIILVAAAALSAARAAASKDELLLLALETAIHVINGERLQAAHSSLKLCVEIATSPPGILSDDSGLAELLALFSAITPEGLNTSRARLAYLYLIGAYSPANPLAAICGIHLKSPQNPKPVNKPTMQPIVQQGGGTTAPEGSGSGSSGTGAGGSTTTPTRPTRVQEHGEAGQGGGSQEEVGGVNAEEVKGMLNAVKRLVESQTANQQTPIGWRGVQEIGGPGTEARDMYTLSLLQLYKQFTKLMEGLGVQPSMVQGEYGTPSAWPNTPYNYYSGGYNEYNSRYYSGYPSENPLASIFNRINEAFRSIAESVASRNPQLSRYAYNTYSTGFGGTGAAGAGYEWQSIEQTISSVTSGSGSTVIDFDKLSELLRSLATTAVASSSAPQASGGSTPSTMPTSEATNILHSLQQILRAVSHATPPATGSAGGRAPETGRITGIDERLVKEFADILRAIGGGSPRASSAPRGVQEPVQATAHPVTRWNPAASTARSIEPRIAPNPSMWGQGGRLVRVDISKAISSALRSFSSMASEASPYTPPSISLPFAPFIHVGGAAPSISAPSFAAPALPSASMPSVGGSPLVLVALLGLVGVVLAAVLAPRLLGELKAGREMAAARLELASIERKGVVENEDIVKLFARILNVLGAKCRPKYPYETHREYEKAVKGEARPVYHEAATVYELAKFGHRSSPSFLDVLRNAIQRLRNAECHGED